MSEKSPSMKLAKKPTAKAKITDNAPAAAEPEAPSKPAVKKASPKTVEATAKPATVEKVETDEGEDLIVTVAKEVENLGSNKAFNLVPKLLDNIDHDYFKLGGVLAKVQAEGWFMEKGYDNFRGFVEAETGLEYRKAMYLIGIYNGLVESGVSWAKVKGLGWTKLKELASLLTPENVDEWVDLAENMTVLQLIAHIKQSEKESTPDASGTDEEAKKVTTMTFKVHADQKATIREALDKCKEMMKTEFDAVALEHVCLDYLSGDKKLKKVPTLTEQMKKKSSEEVLAIFGEVFPEVKLDAEIPE